MWEMFCCTGNKKEEAPGGVLPLFLIGYLHRKA